MSGPDPAVAAARLAVRRSLGDLVPGSGGSRPGPVLVACSGGADSLALAAATAFVAPRLGLSAGAVVVDHRLQPDSAAVADKAAAACRDLGLDPVHVVAIDVGQARAGRGSAGRGSAGPEADARAARYAAMDDVADRVGALAVLLGHTLDDQAETVLLALARGSGARSLAGMAVRRGRYRRPFLGLRRSQTEAVCGALGLPFWTDPTNGIPAGGRAPGAGVVVPGARPPAGPVAELPRRSRLRVEAMPALTRALGPGVVPALARTARLLRDDADLLDALAADLLAAARAAPTPAGAEGAGAEGGARGGAGGDIVGEVVLDVATLAAAHPALRRRALRAAAVEVGAGRGAPTATHVEALDALVVDWRGRGPVHLPGDGRAARECGRLFLRPSQPRSEE